MRLLPQVRKRSTNGYINLFRSRSSAHSPAAPRGASSEKPLPRPGTTSIVSAVCCQYANCDVHRSSAATLLVEARGTASVLNDSARAALGLRAGEPAACDRIFGLGFSELAGSPSKGN